MTTWEPDALNRLVVDTQDRAVVVDLVGKYRRLLTSRRERIERALAEQDDVAGLDAVLSLRVSSSMVGAVGLVELARTIERQLQLGRWDDARELAAGLRARCGETDAALAAWTAKSVPAQPQIDSMR